MGYIDLAYAIVTQAVIDYRTCVLFGKSTDGLVRFFKSKWCDTLLCDSSLNGEMILEKLQQERVV